MERGFSRGDKIVISFALCREITIFAIPNFQAEIAQLVEHQLPKLRAAGSNPVFRSTEAADVRRTSAAFVCDDVPSSLEHIITHKSQPGSPGGLS